MIKRIAKYASLTLLGILLIVSIFFGYAKYSVNQRFEKTYAVDIKPFQVHADSATLALGGHLAITKGCRDCHADDMGGKVLIDDPMLGRISPSNLTSGKGGIAKSYSTEDWVKAIRHGINQDSKPLMLMPSQELNVLTEKDLNALIAYCQSLPPVDRELPENTLKPLGVVLTHLNKIHMISAEVIDHNTEMVVEIPNEVSLEHGKYLAVSCTGCHHPDFKGGPSPIPGSPEVANITQSGHLGRWSETQFIATLRTGLTPEGKQLANEYMPWQMTSAYTDTELKSIYLYLKSL